MSTWTLYIIECRDGTLYTGITTDLEKRIKRHNQGRASKYTRSRKPVVLKYQKSLKNESLARKREAEIKSMSRASKLRMIRNNNIL